MSNGTLATRQKVKFSKKDLVGFLFVLPLILGLLIFHLYPIISSFCMSLEMCLSTEKCSECAPKSVAVDQHPMR